MANLTRRLLALIPLDIRGEGCGVPFPKTPNPLPFTPLRAFLLQRRVDFLRRDRQVADTHADRVFDGVGDGRRHRRDRIFTDAFDFVRSDAAVALER